MAIHIHNTVGVKKTTTSREILAANLARLMERTPGMNSQPTVGKRAGVAPTHIGRILRQESAATIDMLDAIAGAFGLTAWELLTDSEQTRQLAVERMLFGNHVSDDRVEQALPPPPSKVIAMRRRKKA
jgi:hypothetical protein